MSVVADVPAVDNVSAMLVSPLFWHFLYANVPVSAGSAAFATVLIVAGNYVVVLLPAFVLFLRFFFDTYIGLIYKKKHIFDSY